MSVGLPTVLVIDAGREDAWWSLPSLDVAVTLYTATGRVAIARAREFGIDLLVVRAPVADMALDEVLRRIRLANPGVRTVVLHGSRDPIEPDELVRAAPDFVAADSISPVLLSAVLSKMLEDAMTGERLAGTAGGLSGTPTRGQGAERGVAKSISRNA